MKTTTQDQHEKTQEAAKKTGPVISIEGLNQLYNHRTRMGIMAILMVEEWVDFVTLRNTLDLSDGSLASHVKALVSKEQLEVSKRFVGAKPQTRYRATETGREMFRAHLAELEAFISRIDN